jgi:hypothetical protein
MATTILQVGDKIPDLRHAQRYLPLGSVINLGRTPGTRYRLVAPATWLTDDNNPRPMDPYTYTYEPYLDSTPDGEPDSVSITETAVQFLWRLRDSALTSAHTARIGIGNVESCLAKLRARPSDFPLGQGIYLTNHTDVTRLPDDSLIYTGHPSDLRGFGLYRVHDGRVHAVLGSIPYEDGGLWPMYVHRSDPTPAWATAGPEPEDEANLRLIKAKAWTIGMTGKRQHSWCSVLETTLNHLGVTSDSPVQVGESPFVPGDVLTPSQVARLPEGTILGWHWGNGTGYVTLYERSDAARNAAGTHRLWGTDPNGANSHDPMIMLGSSRREFAWRIGGQALQQMPDGTVYEVGEQRFSLTEDTRSQIASWNNYQVVTIP